LPDITTVLIVCGAWILLVTLAWALAVAAGRSETAPGGLGSRGTTEPSTPPQPVVANVGSLRARLRAAAELIDAQQLVVTAEIGGTETTLAANRPLALVEPGHRPSISAPVLRGGRTVATLRAFRRPGEPPFDHVDHHLLVALAARMAADVEVGAPLVTAAGAAPAHRPGPPSRAWRAPLAPRSASR
jgi:hypothetical protein